jgi:hypothetical protein
MSSPCHLQSHRYPLCCPSPCCQECLAHEDVLQLLQGQPALQVRCCCWFCLMFAACLQISDRFQVVLCGVYTLVTDSRFGG